MDVDDLGRHHHHCKTKQKNITTLLLTTKIDSKIPMYKKRCYTRQDTHKEQSFTSVLLALFNLPQVLNNKTENIEEFSA